MKIIGLHIFGVFGMISVGLSSAMAQGDYQKIGVSNIVAESYLSDGGGPDNNTTGPGDLKTNTSTPTSNETKDSSVTVTVAPVLPNIKIQKTPPPIKPAVEKQSKADETDDSVLSFNFLYYLIEKYKLQDIVE